MKIYMLPLKLPELQIWSIMEAKKQFICYWRHIVNINGNIIRLTNKNQWHIFDLQIETVMALHTKTRCFTRFPTKETS